MIAVLLANGFEEIEALTPVDMLRRANADVRTVGIHESVVTGAHGIRVVCDMTYEELAHSLSLVDMVIFPGGMPGAKNLDEWFFTDKIIETVLNRGGHIAAICAAPMVFGHRNLLNGKRATCFPGFEKELYGAIITNEDFTTDGNITTGRGMEYSLPFSKELVRIATERGFIKAEADECEKKSSDEKNDEHTEKNLRVTKPNINEVLSAYKKSYDIDTPACIGLCDNASPFLASVAKMPHLLIHGKHAPLTTAFMKSFIESVAYLTSPEDLRLVIIAASEKEYADFNTLPHLLVPVISGDELSVAALKCMSDEMNRRYELIRARGVRNINAYNEKVSDKKEKLAKIIIAIDGFEKFSAKSFEEITAQTIRFIQKARAAGIYVVGSIGEHYNLNNEKLLTASFPTCIALGFDADDTAAIMRTCVDDAPKESELYYLQIGDTSARKLSLIPPCDDIGAMFKNAAAHYDSGFMSEISARACGNYEKEFPTLAPAIDGLTNEEILSIIEFAIKNQKINPTLVQRKFKLDQAKKLLIIDFMEELKIISPTEAPGIYEVLISEEKWAQIKKLLSENAT